jgi:hypothetical protein
MCVHDRFETTVLSWPWPLGGRRGGGNDKTERN